MSGNVTTVRASTGSGPFISRLTLGDGEAHLTRLKVGAPTTTVVEASTDVRVTTVEMVTRFVVASYEAQQTTVAVQPPIVITRFGISSPGPQGDPGPPGAESPYGKSPTLTYVADKLTQLDFEAGDQKTLAYVGDKLATVTHVRPDKTITKTLAYSGNTLVSVTETEI